MKSIQPITFIILFVVISLSTITNAQNAPVREHLSMDKNWKFAYGHPYDARQDYFHGTLYFSYITKTGNGDGPAAQNFDDRSWRTLDVPHDWAVEQGFSPDASHSHGYKTVGRAFPETSVGWYRKTFTMPEADKGKRISITFDGIHRDSRVWINGFYLGNESSGYYDINYDISPYLNYGGENVIAVRVDVTLEEGWFYEGAGIYRHVWLTKTQPLHVGYNGTFVTSDVIDNKAIVSVQTEVDNDYNKEIFSLKHTVIDKNGNSVASVTTLEQAIDTYSSTTVKTEIEVNNPLLWSLEERNLYTLETKVISKERVLDIYETTFGIRTIEFDPNKGFSLNGKHITLKGTCNHQDHAGVGTAIPDALQEYRIKRLKSMGSNAYRAAHNPPTTELLNACDEMGMLVMVENRLLSNAPEALNRFERMIKRDRNHPSVIVWSVGNEEWAVEGNEKGALLSNELQVFGKKLDTTRPFTIAASGGWGHGADLGMDMIGFNYLRHGDAPAHHEKFPEQLCIGSEESTTQGTRGIYTDDIENGHMTYVDRSPGGTRVEESWQFYDANPWATGMFLWTGFDYRGEANPLAFPAVSSQFGIMDQCGFPKEPYYYLSAWWNKEPFLKITPHWNWKGKEGDTIQVRVNSNCEEVELFLNKKSLGKQKLEKNSLLDWFVPYKSGSLVAKGYKNGKIIISDKVETTTEAATINLSADRTSIKANGEDVSVISIQVNDKKGREVSTAMNEIEFEISGPAKIIGVGNGDPASHEMDRFIEMVDQIQLNYGKIAELNAENKETATQFDFDDSNWPLYVEKQNQMIYPKERMVAVRVEFELNDFSDESIFTLYSKSLAINQSIYLNGKLIAENIERDSPDQVFKLNNELLKKGKNILVYRGTALYQHTEWEVLNTNPGLIQKVEPAKQWKRKVFNGLAQVIIQSTDEAGEVVLKASSDGLKSTEIKIETKQTEIRKFVP